MNKRKLTVVAGTALCALSACLGLAACGGNDHTVKEIGAKDATCTEAGNEHYYMCTDEGCGKYFSDADCKHEVTLEDVVKPALGHDPQKVEAEDATCTTDGHIEYYDCSRCEVNFADAAGTQVLSNDDIFIAKYDHDQIEEVLAQAPTLAADGNVYHWHCDRCEKDFNNRTGDKEIENVVIPKLVKETGLTINVTTYDNATTEGTAPTGTFTLTGEAYPDSTTENVSIASGKLSVTELIPDSYKFEIEGYYPVYFTVEKGVKTYNIDLYKHFHTHTTQKDNGKIKWDYIDGDLKATVTDGPFSWEQIPEITLVNDKIAGENYMIEFKVQYDKASPFDKWTQRFGIRLGTSSQDDHPTGFMFLSDGGAMHAANTVPNDKGLGNGNDHNHDPFDIFGGNAVKNGNVIASLTGDGLKVRASRSGDRLCVSFLVDGEWEKVWDIKSTDLGTGITLEIACPGSTAKISEISYFDSYAATQQTYAYFTTGSGDNLAYFAEDGTPTTLANLARTQIAADYNITVYDGLRNVIENPTVSFTLTNTDYPTESVENVTVAGGKLSVNKLFPGKYTIEIDGYYPVSFTVTRDTESVNIKLYQKHAQFEISNNDSRVIPSEVEEDLQIKFENVNFKSYNPPVVTMKSDKISGTNYMVEFTVQYKDAASWNWFQRFGVRLGTTNQNEKPVGFSFFAAGNSDVRISQLWSGDTGFADRTGDKNSLTKEGQAAAFTTALKGDGVQFRAVRNGDNFALWAYIGTEWVKVGEFTNTGIGTGLAFLASTYADDKADAPATVSNISYADRFVAQTNEKYAYFVKGDKYYTVDGKETTLEGLNIVKIENLTINVTTYLGNNQTDAPTESFTLFGEIEKYTETNVTIVDGKLSVTALYPGKYILILDGWNPECFTVEEGKTEYSFNWFKSERTANVSVDETTGDITYNNPWQEGISTTLKDDITGENYMTEFTLKYQFTEGKNWSWMERFSIILGMSPVDEKPIGFMFFMAGDNEIKGANCVSNDIRWFGDAHEGFTPFAKGSADVAAINTALKGEGLKVRGVRNGNKLTVYFLIGSEWKQAWTKTVEGLSSYMGVTAAHNNSTLTVSGITFGEYVEATSTVAAHLVVGEGATAKVYTLDGVETTLENLAITE